MKEAEFVAALNAPGAFQRFQYVKADSPARAFKGQVTLTREVTVTGRTGLNYYNQAVNAEKTVQPRKWGVRRDRYFVDHTPKSGPNKGQETVYATIFAVEGSFRTRYFVNGEEATREFYDTFRTASAAAGSPLVPGGYMDVTLADLTAIPAEAAAA